MLKVIFQLFFIQNLYIFKNILDKITPNFKFKRSFVLFKFPSFKQMYKDEIRTLKRFRQYFRYHLATNICKNEIKEFENFINKNPIWEKLFSSNFYRANTILYRYCDNRLNEKERLEMIIQNFNLAKTFLGEKKLNELLEKKKILLFKFDENLFLYLNINNIDPLEGFFSINIQTEDEKIYDASFSFITPNSLLISSMQGSNEPNTPDLIKQATKQMHGIRPAFMIVNVFKMICEIKNFSLLGIPKENQAKFRRNDHSRLLFDYDEFWRENGGKFGEKYYEIPLNIERKSLEEIQSKKRSMYKKRFEMLDIVKNSLQIYFQNL
ncbi:MULTISPECIES: VirK/YbjX family protein [unclassified Campylobacter]|uniref:VirK/YbjX family protein n=1 Tax=unclassified Campylobacter TaxID=2593542 RepID=UPI0022E9FE43|nr:MULTISPECIES: DUF535 family protein [unclassified Campylobacter]MDA3065044.1 DUF535 family protein [Campylobacter sp. CN_NE4]MDA3069201.1 DUF535 family protein [Campylobacter sp. CN_NE3]MDA3082129.1 DUF535 family protein [Campylobacter sp. CN_EL2]MDA3083764.1 DUF535 family protein [Campylobacter sp. CN_NE1]MDA3087071.1 DUF535 family protein [Campylobacter sp. CN_NA2]